MSVYCSECDQRGHNRRNKTFHSDTKSIFNLQVTGARRPVEWATYNKRYRLRLAIRGECQCGATITEKRRNGEPMSLCRACLDRNAAKKRSDAEELKRLRELQRKAA